jgi:uncharacterized protein involved in exopolysaccharide biosynthesis
MITFFSALAVAASIGLLRQQIYESHMSLLIGRAGAQPTHAIDAAMELGSFTPSPTNQEVEQQAQSLTNHELLEKVVLTNELQNGEDSWFSGFFFPRQKESIRVARAVSQLDRQLQIHIRPGTNVIEITYRSTIPSRAYGVLNSLAELYLARHALRPPTAFGSRSTPQSQSYQAAIADAESGLREFEVFRDKTGSDRDFGRQLTAAVGQSRTLEHAIASDEQRIRIDQEQMKIGPLHPTPPQDTESSSLLRQNLSARLKAAEAKRSQFLQKYASNYGLVLDVNKEISEVKAAIVAAHKAHHEEETPPRQPALNVLRGRLAQDQADLATKRMSLNAVRQVIEALKGQVIKPDGNTFDDADLEREVNADEQSYLQYLSKREQERVLDRIPAVSAAMAAPPAVPAAPVYGRGIVLLVALGLAAAVSFPAALILDCLDPCFHTPGQVIETLGIPVVLAVPRMTG